MSRSGTRSAEPSPRPSNAKRNLRVCETLAGYFRASEETAGLRCAGAGVTEVEERLETNREMNAILMRLQKQWEMLAAALDKSTSARQGDAS